MDLEAILKQLRDERAQVEVSILAIERLQAGQAPRRGRPPKWIAEAAATAPRKRGRPKGSGQKTTEKGDQK